VENIQTGIPLKIQTGILR